MVLDVIHANGACPSIDLDEDVLDELPERVCPRTWASEMVSGGPAATASARALGEEMVVTEDETKEQQCEEGHGGRRG